jgi:hypothetical protein
MFVTVRIKALTAASMKMTTFWDTASCCLVQADWRFIGVYCLYHQAISAVMMVAVRTFETSVNLFETTWRSVPEGCHLNGHNTSIRMHTVESYKNIPNTLITSQNYQNKTAYKIQSTDRPWRWGRCTSEKQWFFSQPGSGSSPARILANLGISTFKKIRIWKLH